MRRGVLAGLTFGVVVAACSLNYGPSPIRTNALAMRTGSSSAEQVGNLIRQQTAQYAILSGSQDSAYFVAVATAAGLSLTGVGNVGGNNFAFVGPKAVGDTVITLKVPGGGEIHMYDALYEVKKQRHVDLMAIRLDAGSNLQQVMSTLQTYVANDVMANTPLLLALEAPSPAVADTMTTYLRVAYGDAWECTSDGRSNSNAQGGTFRLFYGPFARMKCETAHRVDGDGISGQFVLQ